MVVASAKYVCRTICTQSEQPRRKVHVGLGRRRTYWRPNGEQTRLNRYTIDFTNNVQTNIDNGRRRSIRIIWVRPQDVEAQFRGELPAPEPAEDVDVEGAADVDEEGAADVDEEGEPTFGA